MENFPKRRGRPRKIPGPKIKPLGFENREIPDVARQMMMEPLQSDRTRANAYYAGNAREVVEGLSKQVEMPENPVLAAKLRLGMDWILARRTVLNELGRMMDGERHPTPEQRERFQAAVIHVAARHDRLTSRSACAYIRGRRLGKTERKDRIAALHHDLNAAINLHRQRFPESTWTDIRRALDLTTKQIEHK
jgi:hypothetical protein